MTNAPITRPTRKALAQTRAAIAALAKNNAPFTVEIAPDGTVRIAHADQEQASKSKPVGHTRTARL